MNESTVAYRLAYDLLLSTRKAKRKMKTSDYVTKYYRSAIGYAARLTRHIASAEIWESQWTISSERLFVVNPSSTAGLRGLVKIVTRRS